MFLESFSFYFDGDDVNFVIYLYCYLIYRSMPSFLAFKPILRGFYTNNSTSKNLRIISCADKLNQSSGWLCKSHLIPLSYHMQLKMMCAVNVLVKLSRPATIQKNTILQSVIKCIKRKNYHANTGLLCLCEYNRHMIQNLTEK